MKLISFLPALLLSGSVFSEGIPFEPVSTEQLQTFYAVPERSVSVRINLEEKRHTVAPEFLGINLSYFNTTDEIWKKHGLREKLRKAGIGSLRYPGGEETSFFHWRHPGVNGYEDLWDNPSLHGNSPLRGRFQTTWVHPDQWAENESFMNFDEFMENCISLGAEPVVGLNLSSGKKHNRRADGIREALDWMRYCKEKGYRVTYWFLDNEPWHHEAAHTFTLEEYAEEILAYGSAIKKEFPETKLIANPAAASNLYADRIEQFVRKTGHLIDYIDVHWYWAWGKASFDHWLNHTPLNTDDRWKKPDQIRTYAEEIRMIRSACARAGFPDIGITALEWNIAPSLWSQTFNQSLIAIIQSELLLEFAQNNVRLTALWPLIWQTSRDVWSEQDFFPSVVTTDPPFNETLSLEMFRMLSALSGKTVYSAGCDRKDTVLLAAGDSQETVIYLINKNILRRKIAVNLPVTGTESISAEGIGLKHQEILSVQINPESSGFYFYAEPYSFNAIRIRR